MILYVVGTEKKSLSCHVKKKRLQKCRPSHCYLQKCPKFIPFANMSILLKFRPNALNNNFKFHQKDNFFLYELKIVLANKILSDKL